MEKKGTILMDRYEMGRMLGQGNFAKVYYGKDIKSGKSVAIKVIDKEKTVKAGLSEQLKREISVMKLVKHQNVLELYEIMATKSKIFIVLEYAKGGELFNKVVKGRLKVEIARWIFQQLISAVDCCHKRGVYHRDLKLENLLIDDDGTLKVADFGLSALVESKRQDGMLHTMCGTPAYVAPEVINRKGYDGAKADIWSCGVILYVMLAGYLPFKGANLVDMYKKITRADYSCPNWFPADARRLLLRILDPNPKTRIPISKIMESSWFKKGLGTQPAKLKVDTKENVAVEVQTFEKKLEIPKRTNLNAFDLISMSSGLDLSGLFVGDDKREDIRFTSLQPASAIVSKLEQVATNLNLEVAKKEGGSMKLAGSGGARKEGVGIDVEIFEFAPSFHLVEMKKANGDSLDYQKVLKQDIQPALNDIVWAWQGDNQMQQQKQEINGVWNPLQTEINVF